MTKQQIESVVCSIVANVPYGTLPSDFEVVCYLEDKGIEATKENVAAVQSALK